ncbi:COX15/CtaA family protein [Gorillibacterium sp. sgz5001074]|uniref:COX15/CtaA family protein n=1 Tax=Gorillibacterium sp. sgz5001074 TaxID=3446695 RepID=UPI003F67CB27
MNKQMKRLALWTCILMFLVLVMGALVTKTESGRGCGDDWPLCNGKFVPAYTIESLIEYSHRFVTGITGILVLASFLAAWRYSRRRDVRFYASGALIFTVIQALMGAFAVMWPQSPPVLALHFGFSLIAFACTLLLAVVTRDHDPSAAPEEAAARHRTELADMARRSQGMGRLRNLSWLVTIYCYAVVYLGAYVRHTQSSGGCGRDWPLCNGELIPDLTGASGIVFVHRIGAVLLLLLIGRLAYEAKQARYPKEIRTYAALSFYLVMLQAASGAFVTFSLGSDWYLLAGLIHAMLIAGLFGTLSYLSALTLLISRSSKEEVSLVN